MKEFRGYPEYVIISLPKCGTKSMNKCFSSLGYRFGINFFLRETPISFINNLKFGREINRKLTNFIKKKFNNFLFRKSVNFGPKNNLNPITGYSILHK